MDRKEQTMSHNGKLEKKGDWRGFISGEFLYWKARVDDLIFAFKTTIPPDNSSANLKSEEIDFIWDPGFRIGGGLRLPYDLWNLSFFYTYFHSKPEKTLAANQPNQFLSPPFTPGLNASANIVQAQKAKISWDVHFQCFDLLLSRSFSFTQHLSIQPKIGISGTILHQSSCVHYEGIAIPSGMISPPLFMGNNAKNNFWGIGPLLGLDSRWVMGKFGIFANLTASGTWAKFTLLSQSKNVIISNGTANFAIGDVTDRRNSTRVRPGLRFLVGFDWVKELPKDSHLHIALGYEIQYWWSLLQPLFQNNISPESILTFSGLTATAAFSF